MDDATLHAARARALAKTRDADKTVGTCNDAAECWRRHIGRTAAELLFDTYLIDRRRTGEVGELACSRLHVCTTNSCETAGIYRQVS